MFVRSLFRALFAMSLLLPLTGATASAYEEGKEPPPATLTFGSDVLPILKAKCLSCHSGAKPKGGLNLSTRRDLMWGGKSGAVVRRAAAESSLLWARIASGEMPPKGQKLSAEEKGIIRTWINEGASGKGEDLSASSGRSASSTVSEEAKQFWAFKRPLQVTAPSANAKERIRNPIDAFVLHKLEDVGLTLAADADRRSLIRRVSFDLRGLPPDPQQVAAFLNDPRADAYERLIDDFLTDPSYGERWGRHWLDVAGYADSAGILSEDRNLPLAYRYRDYVIRALNKDKPYDRFLEEQIAGDELVDYWNHYEHDDSLSEDVIEAITATGFLRCAPDASRPDFKTIKNADALYFYPTINDTMQIVATSVMGMTLQCARCHDHMFDPITQEDYYRVQAVFMGAFRPTDWVPQMERRLTTLSKSQLETATKRNKEIENNAKKVEDEITKLRDRFAAKRYEAKLAQLPMDMRRLVRAALETQPDKLDEAQKTLAQQHRPTLRPDNKTLDKILPAEYPEYQALRRKLKEQIAAERARWYDYDEIRAVYDLPGDVETPFLRRGDPLTPVHAVSPGALSVIQDAAPYNWTPPNREAKTSGRRLAFARWLTDPNHPLTARVMVNRIWKHHFGVGIVATPGDFGQAGSLPSHPELLDWLAVEFVEHDWSIKHLHRLILTSSAYRQRSQAEVGIRARTVDPENRLLWRQRLRRLEAESIRDAVLRVAGTLKSKMFGAAIGLHVWPDGETTVFDGADPHRRSIYLQNLRLRPVTILNAFDQPVMETNCLVRSRSTVPTQALAMLNSKLISDASDAFARRLLVIDHDPVGNAVQLAFGRPPDDKERETLNAFLASQERRHANVLGPSAATDEVKRRAIADMCHMLLSANEFIYID